MTERFFYLVFRKTVTEGRSRLYGQLIDGSGGDRLGRYLHYWQIESHLIPRPDRFHHSSPHFTVSPPPPVIYTSGKSFNHLEPMATLLTYRHAFFIFFIELNKYYICIVFIYNIGLFKYLLIGTPMGANVQ